VLTLPPLATGVVGSLPQPGWLIDRERLGSRLPPRVRARELWRVAPDELLEAQDDATVLAIGTQRDAGMDIVTDGEVRRESYSNHFATALAGLDLDHPAEIPGRSGRPNLVPRVVGPLRRRAPVGVRDAAFLRAHTDRVVKITMPGPFTMAQQVYDEHYGDPRQLALAYAGLVNDELHELFAAGADIVQLDEPYLQAHPDAAREYGIEVVNRALQDATGPTAIHLCFGYASMVHERPSGYSFLPELSACSADMISIETAQSGLDTAVLRELPGKTICVGAVDLSDPRVESDETVAARVRRALEHVDPERIVISTDCGMKYLPRDSAAGKMRAMASAAMLLRAELGIG
jgi:5-methyltetrahydropteroyltriglutamate--homocysteine methyltransferase